MSTERSTSTRTLLSSVAFGCILCGFWLQVQQSKIVGVLGGHTFSAFLCFALLLAPLWFFGFGLGDALQSLLKRRAARVLAPVLLAVPYLIFSIPRGEFQLRYAIALALLPVILAAVFEFRKLEQAFTGWDLFALLSLALILELRVFSGAWPYPGLGSLPKIYLADVALYVYIVVRKLEGAGYSFVPTKSAFGIGLREWAFFAPIGIGLGLALGFIRFYPRHHSALDVVAGLLITFLLTAVPEELFFRGLLQNLLEPRLGRLKSLLVSSALFGLSHFHKGAMFNGRYVLLAFLAGIFYGRAWRSRRQLLASSTTHTLVDVVWSLWFR